MFQVIYEYDQPPSDNGAFLVSMPPLEAKISVTPDSARKKANGYLARYVALVAEAHTPSLVWGARPMWRMQIYLTLPEFGRVALLGEIDVDAQSRDALPLSEEQITKMQDRADIIASRLTSSTN